MNDQPTLESVPALADPGQNGHDPSAGNGTGFDANDAAEAPAAAQSEARLGVRDLVDGQAVDSV